MTELRSTPKPSYATTKRQIAFSTAFAWLIIFMVTSGGIAGVREAVDIANIVVPSMVMLITALLGIHRLTGSMDFRAAQERPAEEPSAPSGEARSGT